MLPVVRIPASPIIVCLASLLACGSREPVAVEPTSSITTPPPTQPPEPEPEPEPSEPAIEASTDCQVQLLVKADGASNGKIAGPFTLRANAKNLTDAPLQLTLPDSCPDGEATFSGLETARVSHYDYYGTCAMGMCAGGRPPIVIDLPPGEVVTIVSTEISPKGEGPCNEAIAAGTYKLTFKLRSDKHPNPVLCGPEPLRLTR